MLGYAYRFGLWTADLFGRVGLIIAELLAIAHLALATWCSRKWFEHTYPGVWWFIAGALLVAWTQLGAKCSAERERRDRATAQEAEKKARAEEAEARRQAKQHELDSICEYKGHTAGNLARLCRSLIDGGVKKDASALQSAFLAHAVNVVKDYLELDRKDDRISATWTIAVDDYTKWQVVAYDRNHTHRQPGTKRDLLAGIPGAAEAYLTGKNQYIEDSHDAKVASHFKGIPTYRGIVSVPARIVNSSRRIDCKSDGNTSAILGVLNVDCLEPGVLRPDIAKVVADIAFLLAVIEHLKGR